MSEKFIDVNSYEQYFSDMQKYAVYISRSRVTCDYRDGQKPVQRKILYAMYKEGAIKEPQKSAAIVGEIMRHYHPHGDVGIYGTMKPMANWFEDNLPLIYTESNFGNFQGDGQAASRYTDVRLSDFGYEAMVSDLADSDKAVDWIKNYDGTTVEPEYLPAKLPILLINGTFGIGAGLKAEIPAHNINEVIDATINLIKNPNASVVLIPDHCMPCEIIDTNWKGICNKGIGTYKVRGIIECIEYRGYPCLQIKSMPDLVFLDSIRSKITDLIDKNILIQVKEEEDLSTSHNLDYRIILKKGSDPEYVKQVIYANTDMEKSCRINFEVLDGINLLRMSYKSYLQAFIEFRKLTKFRLYCNRLEPVQTRMHQLDAYIKVLQSGFIDEIIETVRKYKGSDSQYLIDFICKKTKITPLQAKFIITRQLSQLSIGNLNSYITEYADLERKKADYIEKITNEDFASEIIDELQYYKKKYGTPVRRKLVAASDAAGIPKGTFKVIITDKNSIKKIQENDIVNIKGNEYPKSIIKVDNTENIIIFDEQGKIFKLPVSKIPFTDKSSNGTDSRMLNKNMTSNINVAIYEPILKMFADKIMKYYVVVLTKFGFIKKMDIEDILSATLSGILYIKLDNGDTVQDIKIVPDKAHLIVYSLDKAVRFDVEEVPYLKRSTKGNKAIDLGTKPDNIVKGMTVLLPDATDIVCITANGKMNRFSSASFGITGRAKRGGNVIKLGANDRLVSIDAVTINDSIIVTTDKDRITIPVNTIQSGSTISAGVKMIDTKDNNIYKCDILKATKS